MFTAKFRVIEADLITSLVDTLILDVHRLFIGTIEPPTMDVLDGNLLMSIEPIKFNRLSGSGEEQFGNGFYGVGHYYEQIEPTVVTLLSNHPSSVIRQDTFGSTGSATSELTGFLFIGEPDKYDRRRVIYRGKLTDSTVYASMIPSLVVNQINSIGAPRVVCEITLEAFSDPFAAIDSFSLIYPNMAGVHTASLMYDSDFSSCP
jgi:hypothetical protein